MPHRRRFRGSKGTERHLLAAASAPARLAWKARRPPAPPPPPPNYDITAPCVSVRICCRKENNFSTLLLHDERCGHEPYPSWLAAAASSILPRLDPKWYIQSVMGQILRVESCIPSNSKRR